MKTKNPSDGGPLVALVACSPIVVERIRASLRRGPFRFRSVATLTSEEDGPDLIVAPVESLGTLPESGIPVIAFGPAGLLRAAFLTGCADYLKDPWEPEELALRAQAVAERTGRHAQFPWGSLRLENHDLLIRDARIPLTRNERVILRALLRVRGRPVPRESLAALLGTHRRPPGGPPALTPAAASRTIDVQVSAIRRKVRAAAPEAGRFIVCARGQGYMAP